MCVVARMGDAVGKTIRIISGVLKTRQNDLPPKWYGHEINVLELPVKRGFTTGLPISGNHYIFRVHIPSLRKDYGKTPLSDFQIKLSNVPQERVSAFLAIYGFCLLQGFFPFFFFPPLLRFQPFLKSPTRTLLILLFGFGVRVFRLWGFWVRGVGRFICTWGVFFW